MLLTEHFNVYEMCKSETALRRGLDNVPNQFVIDNLTLLCQNVLEPVRMYFNAPVKVTSGYRSPDVNAAVGGSRTSDHTRGMAADIEIPGLPNYDLAVWIAENLQFTQLILEFYTPGIPDSGWVHVSYDPRNLKCQSLSAIRMSGKTIYEQGLRQ